jgi:hypothetical protein
VSPKNVPVSIQVAFRHEFLKSVERFTAPGTGTAYSRFLHKYHSSERVFILLIGLSNVFFIVAISINIGKAHVNKRKDNTPTTDPAKATEQESGRIFVPTYSFVVIASDFVRGML